MFCLLLALHFININVTIVHKPWTEKGKCQPVKHINLYWFLRHLVNISKARTMGNIAETTKYGGGNINVDGNVIFAIDVDKLYIKGQIYGINSSYKNKQYKQYRNILKTNIDY